MRRFFKRIEVIAKTALKIATPLIGAYKIIKDVIAGGNHHA